MATIGLDKLFYAPITEAANGDETYGTPVQLAKAISADLSVELAEATLYADDGASEVVKEFKSGTLSLGVDDINPIYKSRCSAIRVEQKRSTITAEFAAMALKVAKEYWQKAKYDDNYANGQFIIDMKRENLYRETDRRIKQK